MFCSHKCNDLGTQQIRDFKEAMSRCMQEVDALMPDGREKAIFITKIEEAVFFGTKAIASKQGNYTSIEEF